MQDIRSGIRIFRRNPGFGFAVVAIMALSIGSCTTVFSIVKAVLLTKLPYVSSDRLVIIWHTIKGKGTGVIGMAPRDYTIYRDTTFTFDSIAAVTTAGYNLSTASEPLRVTVGRVTSSLFPLLRIPPFRGRWFSKSEGQASANRVVILNYKLWRERFNSDEAILGKSISLDLVPYTVVGIMPANFEFPPEGVPGLAPADCWIPAGFSGAEMTMPSFSWIVFARLRPQATIAEARGDAVRTAQQVLRSYPAAVQRSLNLTARVISLNDQVTENSRAILLVFTIAVAFLFLIGCANIANLYLARLQIRQRELAIRTAIGAGPMRLLRQLSIESLVLSSCGGVAGVIIAAVLLHFIKILSPGNVPRLSDARIDPLTLFFAVGCSLGAGLLCGLAPALRFRLAVAETLAEGGRASSTGVQGNRLRSALIILESAMAFMLLIGAGLLVRTFLQLSAIPPGFNPDKVLTFSLALPSTRYAQTARVQQFVSAMLDGIHRLPQVMHVAAASNPPLGASDYTAITRPDAPPPYAGAKPVAIQTISPEYPVSLGIPLKRGRTFQESDNRTALPVALINETMAHEYWPDVDVLGRQVQWIAGSRMLTIVGVIGDVRQNGLDAKTFPTLYIPFAQSPDPVHNLVFVARTAGPALNIVPGVRRIAENIDNTLPVFGIRSAEQLVSHSVAPRRYNMVLLACFSLAALLLTTLGIYAVTSYIIGHSMRDFGIRIALGSTPSALILMVIRHGLLLVGVGLLIGIGAAIGLTRFMSSLLFGVGSSDLVTFTAVAALLISVSTVALLVPALRVTGIDPAVALRYE